MKRLGIIVLSMITSLITALVVVWLSEGLVQDVPSPQRLWLLFQNGLSATPNRAEGSFRIVLCWLENDRSGKDTRNVEDAFSGVEGITLVVSAKDITASGAADEWRPAMQHSAVAVLEEWNADLAIVGTVKEPGRVLGLWFVPREGDGTLRRADRPYTLEETTLGGDFHEDFRTQLAAMAWNAVAPLANTETRSLVLERGLQAAAEKLSGLLGTSTISRPEHRAALYAALGDALSTLATREAGTNRLEQSVEAYLGALDVYTRRHAPRQWARVQHSLGLALADLGERESGTARLEQAVSAYHEALKVFSRERTPRYWAAATGHLGSVLRRLGERETGTDRLEEAIAAHRAALKVFTREKAPDDWAFEQDHLGNALSILGERTNSTALLEQALDAHHGALEVLTRGKVPFSWATVQHNLGITLMTLGRREGAIAYFEQSVSAFHAALQERTRDHTPLGWAMTHNALGRAFQHLGELRNSRKFLMEAQNAYRAALEVLGSSGAPRHREMAQKNLEVVSRLLQELGLSPTVAQ